MEQRFIGSKDRGDSECIENRNILTFDYFAPSGESSRSIEPYFIVFKWTSWYVWGWCMSRKDFRLFKLNRMDRVAASDKTFECREVLIPDLSNEKIFPGGIRVKAFFTSDVKWRLVEEFGPDCFTEAEDGRLLFTADYTDLESLVTWLLTLERRQKFGTGGGSQCDKAHCGRDNKKLYGGLE